MSGIDVERLTRLRDLIMPSINQTKHNFAPFLREIFDLAINGAERSPEDWTPSDALKIFRLDLHLRDSLTADSYFPSIAVPAELAAAIAELQDFLAAIGPAGRLRGGEVELDGPMMASVGRAQALADTLFNRDGLGDEARDALHGLRMTLACAEQTRRARIGLLDAERENAAQAVGAAFRDNGRELAYLVGLALIRFPDRAVDHVLFVDNRELWAPEMVVVPACPGGFLMGSPEDQEGHYQGEEQHRVTIPQKFALGRFSLTFDEYDAFCDATEREKPSDENWGRARHPAINVSWKDAQAWCAWMREQTGVEYRLPSEAEWEYACRGDATGENVTQFCPQVARVGSGAYITADEANFYGNRTFNGSPEGEYLQKTVPVDHAAFNPNRFGLWQMQGNVDEWCEDVFEEDYDQTPTDGSAHLPQPLLEDHYRVLRGGSWSDVPQVLRSANRSWSGPDNRYDDFGFRPARTLLTP